MDSSSLLLSSSWNGISSVLVSALVGLGVCWGGKSSDFPSVMGSTSFDVVRIVVGSDVSLVLNDNGGGKVVVTLWGPLVLEISDRFSSSLVL